MRRSAAPRGPVVDTRRGGEAGRRESPRRCMERDSGILEAACRPPMQPAGRVYTWKRPSLSVGRSSRLSPDFVARLAREGIGVVRRPTGGALLVHGHDVSYCVAAARVRTPFPVRSSEAARWLAEPVREALAAAGVTAAFRGEEGRGEAACASAPDRLCLEQKAGIDLLVRGRKVAAFAQRVTRDGVLQHGSIFVDDLPPEWIARFVRAGCGSLDSWTAARAAVTSVRRLGGPGLREIRAALRQAVERWVRSAGSSGVGRWATGPSMPRGRAPRKGGYDAGAGRRFRRLQGGF